jgi:hypothetical protein
MIAEKLPGHVKTDELGCVVSILCPLCFSDPMPVFTTSSSHATETRDLYRALQALISICTLDQVAKGKATLLPIMTYNLKCMKMYT